MITYSWKNWFKYCHYILNAGLVSKCLKSLFQPFRLVKGSVSSDPDILHQENNNNRKKTTVKSGFEEILPFTNLKGLR